MATEKAIMVSCEGDDALRRRLRILSMAENLSVAKLVRQSIDAHLGEKFTALPAVFFAQSDASKHQNGVEKRQTKKGVK